SYIYFHLLLRGSSGFISQALNFYRMYRMKKLLLFVFIALPAFQSAWAQSSLTILNGQNGAPLGGASIRHLESRKVYVADSLGIARLEDSHGPHGVSHIGFKSKVVPVNPASGEITVYLDPDVQFLRGVEV